MEVDPYEWLRSLKAGSVDPSERGGGSRRGAVAWNGARAGPRHAIGISTTSWQGRLGSTLTNDTGTA
jgi:hypothetical protein